MKIIAMITSPMKLFHQHTPRHISGAARKGTKGLSGLIFALSFTGGLLTY